MRTPTTIAFLSLRKYLVIMLLLFPLWMVAQLPVTVTGNLLPPYSVKLADYATANSDRMVFNLLMRDVNEFNRQVILKLSVKGNNGFSAQSAQVVMGANPITLNGGIPTRLTNIDLRPYFQFENLVGVTPQQYSRPLPAGLYQFCFEVYDYLSGQQLSQKGCATAYIVLNDPPILNIPDRGENVAYKEHQNIIFQWTPRHINATNVQYEFTLAEIWDSNIDPQAAFLASRPLYQTTTRSNMLLYGPTETPLLAGKNYGWRVRAIVTDGISELSLFKNNGYSEIYNFNYTKQCSPPQFVLSESNSHSSAMVYWQGVDHDKYQIQYRKKDRDHDRWYEVNAYNEQAKIQRLEESTTYEYRVGGQCGENGGFTFSRLFEFTTTTRGGSDFVCGVTPEIDIDNQEPLPELGINEVFTAGEFPITVKRVDGGDGYFTGWGYITVPYLADTRIKIGFNNIKINNDYQLIDGILVTAYDPSWGGLDDIQDEIDAVGDIVDTVGDTVGDVIETVGDVIDSIGSDNTISTTDPDVTNTEDTEDPDPDVTITEDPPKDTETIKSTDPPIDPETTDEPDDNKDNENEIFIRYKGIDYKNGDTIEIPYTNDLIKQQFEISESKENSKTEWSTHKDEHTEAVSTALGSKPVIEINISHYTETYMQVEYWGSSDDFPDGDSQKVRVLLKVLHKKFELTELYAADGNNNRRQAKSDEILYLIKSKGVTSPNDRVRKVNYRIETTPEIIDVNKNHLKWNYIDGNGNLKEERGKKDIARTLWESDNSISTSVNAGYPVNENKNVNVEWFENYRVKAKVVPAEIKKALKALSEYVNKMGTIFQKLDKSGKLEFKVGFIEEEYSQEDDNSRFYFIKKEAGIEGGIEFAFKGFTYGIELKLVTAKLYVKPVLKILTQGELLYVKRNDQSDFKQDQLLLTFTPKLDLIVGGKIGFDFYIVSGEGEPFAGLSSWGQIKYYQKTNKIQGAYGIGKPYVGIKGSVIIFGQDLLPSGEIKKTWENIKFEDTFEYDLNKK